MRKILLALQGFVFAACATAGSSGNDGVGPDAAGGGHVGVDAAPVGPTSQLLLSEIALAPTAGEFIEIFNPNTAPVDLSNYYLSDNGNYFKLPAGVPTVTAGDFIVKFPAGATIAAHGVVTVAISTTTGFTTTYGSAPTYAIGDSPGTLTTIASTFTPSLTDAGEIVVLFEWDGTGALVRDVDIMLAGVPTTANSFVDKSSYAQNGSTYATDADSMQPQPTTPATGKSTKRVALKTGHMTQSGSGNGIGGADETSETTSMTWDTTFSAPTPGVVSSGLQ